MTDKLRPITPGEVLLEEFLQPMEISQIQLAKDLNVPANRISQIIALQFGESQAPDFLTHERKIIEEL